MLNILIIAGHGNGDPGACSSYGTEAEETRKVTNKLQQLLKPYANVIMYPQSLNAYADVCNGTFAASLSNIDYVFEVHFNSASEAAKGTEVWVTPIEGSTAVEQKIVNNLASCGFVNRGVKSEYFAVINYCKNRGVSSALVETCFISNKDDMQTYKSKLNQICEAMAKGIVEGFGMTYKVQEASKVDASNKIEYKARDYDFLALNTANELLSNASIRKALSLLLDKNNIVVSLPQGKYTAIWYSDTITSNSINFTIRYE